MWQWHSTDYTVICYCYELIKIRYQCLSVSSFLITLSLLELLGNSVHAVDHSNTNKRHNICMSQIHILIITDQINMFFHTEGLYACEWRHKWCHDMKTLYEVLMFLWLSTTEQTVELLIVWDAMTLECDTIVLDFSVQNLLENFCTRNVKPVYKLQINQSKV